MVEKSFRSRIKSIDDLHLALLESNEMDRFSVGYQRLLDPFEKIGTEIYRANSLRSIPKFGVLSTVSVDASIVQGFFDHGLANLLKNHDGISKAYRFKPYGNDVAIMLDIEGNLEFQLSCEKIADRNAYLLEISFGVPAFNDRVSITPAKDANSPNEFHRQFNRYLSFLSVTIDSLRDALIQYELQQAHVPTQVVDKFTLNVPFHEYSLDRKA